MGLMLLAYIDEIGEAGAFVSHDHRRFNTSAAFGYAGFVVPLERAREFGGIFTREKRTLFKTEIAAAAEPARWERKGAEMFRRSTAETHPQYIRVFTHLAAQIVGLGGHLFYYADEKARGTPGQVHLDPVERERNAMQETLNRLCRHADTGGHDLMVIIDHVNESTRAQRLPNMYGHIFSRTAGHPEMARIVEPPMHVDSKLSSNVQFADWVAAVVSRAIDNQLIRNSQYAWVPDAFGKGLTRKFTNESKVHLWDRGVDDIVHSRIFSKNRPLYPVQRGSRVDPAAAELLRRIHATTARPQ